MSSTNFDLLEALQQIAVEKGIAVDTLFDALANALVAAYKRLPRAAEEAVVTIDPDSGEIRVYGQELDEEGNVTARVGRHSRGLRAHRGPSGAPGDPPAHPRGRTRPGSTRSTQGARVTSSQGSSSRATIATPFSTWARSRHFCLRPSRSPMSATTTAPVSRLTSSRSARRARVLRSSSRAATPGS